MLCLRTLFESNEEKSRHTSFKRRRKLILDWMMVVTLLFLMSYELIGRAFHEWLGIGMLFLVIGHHIMNIRWSKAALDAVRNAFVEQRKSQFLMGINRDIEVYNHITSKQRIEKEIKKMNDLVAV